MNNFKVLLDEEHFKVKPKNAAVVSKRIGDKNLQVSTETVNEFVSSVSRDGQTFCPATFKNGRRCKTNFEQQQLFVLDFDNPEPDKAITFEEVKARADKYDLPILFAYDTLSSSEHNKFRVVFQNDISIPDREIAEAMQLAIGTMFPEADSSCYKDVSKMYYGGKELLYYDESLPEINLEMTFMSLTCCMKRRYKATHYKEKLAKFSEKTGIALNNNGLLDIKRSAEPPTESTGAKPNNNGKTSPRTILYEKTHIDHGEIFPSEFYSVNLNGCTGQTSVGNEIAEKTKRNHNLCRSNVLYKISEHCQLYREFQNGDRHFKHEELFGIATNMIQVETGAREFREILSEHKEPDNEERVSKWGHHLSYMQQMTYNPQRCDGFCPYYKQCIHGKNILSSVMVRSGTPEKISGAQEVFYPIEQVQEDTYYAIYDALCANDTKVHVIKAMTSVGKSTSYLKMMKKNPCCRILVAVPTNLLKDEIFGRTMKMGINAIETPSLEEIKDELPEKVREKIEFYYQRGLYKQVQIYIQKTLEKNKIPCLEEYQKEREKLKEFEGCVITTHRYLMTMDEKRLKEFDAIIIDEDIIFKSVITNQETISLKKLKKLYKKHIDCEIDEKIKELLKLAETQKCITLKGFEWDNDDDDPIKSIPFDITSFCGAERFYVLSASESGMNEKAVIYVKPAVFKNVKYIMVSATASEQICKAFFGDDRVEFYECKKAKYKGNLYQYPQKSMSRTCIDNNPGIVKRLMNNFKMSSSNVITFKKEKIGNLHFGNTEGSNTLEGQDILVVGTPYHTEFLYKLIAYTLEVEFDEDENMFPQTVVHNGYLFRFTTFQDEDLKAVHMWMIESELEQAVGRARLLRNACNVYLFSNFPLSQAQVVDNYDFTEK